MKLNLADLFYDLGFDNINIADIERFVQTRGKDKPVPDEPELRAWAEKTANKFEVKSN